MPIVGYDHVALPTAQPEAMLRFYRALGFDAPEPKQWAESGVPFFSIHFGANKINVHTPGLWDRPDFDLRGPTAVPGCADLCLVWDGGLDALKTMLADAGVEIVTGPVERDGGRGQGRSIYIRDPDQNLLEFIVYDE